MDFEHLTRRERIAANRVLQAENRNFPCLMVRIPKEKFVHCKFSSDVLEVWRNFRLMAVVYHPQRGGQRITINRSLIDVETGRFVGSLTWDDLQEAKAQVGFGDRWAVEIFPPTSEVVNVANMRHLWLVEEAPAFAWRRDL